MQFGTVLFLIKNVLSCLVISNKQKYLQLVTNKNINIMSCTVTK